MKYEELEYIAPAEPIVDEAPNPPNKGDIKDGKRTDPRFELVAQAVVSIPPLPSRVYGVREVSRGGMFLTYKDRASVLLDMQNADIEVGANAEIAFATSITGQRHRFHVRARIARIAREGIGVQFLTRNPPQLAALRTLFSQGSIDVDDTIWEPKGAARGQ